MHPTPVHTFTATDYTMNRRMKSYLKRLLSANRVARRLDSHIGGAQRDAGTRIHLVYKSRKTLHLTITETASRDIDIAREIGVGDRLLHLLVKLILRFLVRRNGLVHECHF